ncbi:unnamed protein product [Rotaria sp. Silwood2]|nr:unnamed protein product [Rotaria sp. Silwood2]CAF4509965.1 unnamed protein product [Rotaria sp. Silwood2]CAF4695492.1 unnamed protein product [Rotaria sp. Silwood2]
MSPNSNICQRSDLTQRVSKEKKTYSCITYPDDPLKYSIADSKRLSNVDDRGFGIIKELGKSYNIRIEQTGTQESMERYAQLFEKAMQSKMHEEVPSDCEDWRATQEKTNQLKSFTTPLTTTSKSRK